MSEIRVRNDTGEPLDTVRMTGLAGVPQPWALGPLPHGAVSDWHPVTVVRRYPAIEASGPGTDLVHLPYEGEAAQPALPDGRYTYVLRLEEGRLVVGLEPEDG
ncbi:MAG TPA: hypothetical protein VES40_05755 [Ilumatobacteraceae bacterium]|nr:hypothetical protein [Ilumatobacteraceae bacterium]